MTLCYSQLVNIQTRPLVWPRQRKQEDRKKVLLFASHISV